MQLKLENSLQQKAHFYQTIMCVSEYSAVNADRSSYLNLICLTMKFLDLKKNPDQNSINVGSGIRVLGLGKSPKINKRRGPFTNYVTQ